MVKTVRALVLAAAAIACLAGCNLAYSIYPDRLMTYEGYVNLARHIDYKLWDFNFSIVRDSTSGAEYLVLASDNRGFGGVHVMVFDPYLRVLAEYTLADLDAMDAAPFQGAGAMVDQDGRIVIGNRAFVPGSKSLAYDGTVLPQLWQDGLAVPEGFDQNIADIRCEGDTLQYRRYQANWTFTTPVLKNVGWGSWSKLAGAWHAGGLILLLMYHDVSPAHIVQLDPLDFTSGGFCDPVSTCPTTWAVNLGDLAWETLGYTKDGFAVYRWDTSEYILFDESGVVTRVSPIDDDTDRPHEQLHVYGRDSGWFILDRKNNTLERRAWWWK
jgi:hypothetical protein